MRILQIHNHYQCRGGEDIVVAAEHELLRAHGHQVELLAVDNRHIQGWRQQARVSLGLIASAWGRELTARALASFRPDLVHVHNFFPLLSPSIYDACQAAGVPVVQTLHNFRLICPNALCFRDGHPCKDCVGRPVPWPAALHGCYRQNRLATTAVAAMLCVHRLRRTWQRNVAAYIALSDFARERFIEGGLPAAKLVVKPNFVEFTPAPGTGAGQFALCVGRLSEEKGTRVLLEAWARHGVTLPLRIVGDGPLAGEVQEAARHLPGVRYMGRLPRPQVLDLMAEATVLVVPSICYENFPMAVVEAYAVGLPVLASRLGSLESIVQHGRTGQFFRPHDAEDLATQLRWLQEHPSELAQMRAQARTEFENRYTATRNHEALMRIYQQARTCPEPTMIGTPVS